MKLSEKDVIKHSAAIQMTNAISLAARRLWNVLLANAYNDLPFKTEHVVDLPDLKEAIGMPKSRNISYLKELFLELTSTSVQWNVLGKDKEFEWGACSLLSLARITKNQCRYEYNSFLCNQLYNPRIYARINLSIQRLFSSRHSLAIYELLVDYLGCGQTPLMDVSEFRKLMGLEKGEYEEFKELNKKVIKASLAEITKKSNITAVVEYKKERKAVVALRFCPRLKSGSALKEVACSSSDIVDNPVYQRLTNDFGLSRIQAIEILTTQDATFISGQLDAIEKEYRENSGKIKKLPAYTYAAITQKFNYESAGIETDKKQQQKRQEKQKRQEEKLEELKNEYRRYRKEEISKFRTSLAEDELKRFENLANAEAKEKAGKNRFLVDSYFKIALEGHLLQAMNFISFDAWSQGKI